MTTYCTPISCQLKDDCLLHATEEVLAKGTAWAFTDYSVLPKVEGQCPHYTPIKPKE